MAGLLLRLRNDPRLRARDSRTAYRMRFLKHLELVEEHNHLWVAAIPPVGLIVMVLSSRLVNPSIFDKVQSIADGYKFLLEALPFLALPIIAIGGLTLLLHNIWLPEWRLTWLGEDMLLPQRYIRSQRQMRHVWSWTPMWWSFCKVFLRWEW